MNRGLILLLALGCGSATDALDDSPAGTGSPVDTSDSPWGCLGEAPEMVPREPGRVTYTLPVVDADDGAAVPGLEVAACVDPGCAQELPRCSGESEQCYEVTGDRVLVFGFPFGFEGSLRFRARGYVETDYVLGGPMVGAPGGELAVTGNAIAMLSDLALHRVHDDLGQPAADPARGTLIVQTLDCAGQPAGGVQISSIAGDLGGSRPFVMTDFNYVSTASTTDARGSAGFANLAPQDIIVAAVTPGGTELVRSEPIHVRADAITLSALRTGLGVWGQ